MADLEGRTLDRYELEEVVGRGGMADVYRGFDPVFQRVVAVKVFKRDDEEMLRRFVREAQLMASLSNPHLMPIYDTGESKVDGILQYYIVMPFMDGGALRGRIRRSPLSPVEACRYLGAIADALGYIHSLGIIHRDIKSSNVLLSSDGHCYLSDFGIARTTTDVTKLTMTGNVLGTVDYVAPELFEVNRRADARSDLYSLGVLLFEMVTGQLPFSAENQIALVSMHVNKRPPSPRSLSQNISPQAERVILKALEKKPEQRYGSASELAGAFCRAAATRSKNDVQESVGMPVRGQSAASAETVQDAHPFVPPPPFVPLARSTEAHPPYPLAPAGRQTPAYPYPAAPARTKTPAPPARTRGRIVTVLALVALLLMVGPIVYVLLTHVLGGGNSVGVPAQTQTTTAGNSTPTAAPTATPNLTATAQVAAAATQQAKNATATAIAGATATVQVQASATAGVIQTATAGKAVYTDPLTDPNNATTQAEQWQQGNGHCAFQADGYHVTEGTDLLDRGLLRGCLEAGAQYQNVAISVDVSIISGHTGGLFFRVGPKAFEAYSGYLFEIDSQGNYKISRSGNFSTGSGNTTWRETTSSALKTGNNVKNTLQVIARNSNLSFYINGVYLGTWQDTTFTTGYIAFLATTTAGGANADMVYSNLNVYAQS